MFGPVTVAALLAALLPMMTGCGNSGATSPEGSTGPAVEWKRYSPAGARYTELPAAWETADAGSIADAGGIDNFTRDHPEIDVELRQFSTYLDSASTLMGIDRSSEGRDVIARTHLAANITVIQVDLGSSARDPALLEQLLNVDEKSAEGLPGGDQNPQVTLSRMAGIAAGSIRYHQIVPSGDAAGTRITELDHIVVKDGIGYGVFCTSTSDDFDRIGFV